MRQRFYITSFRYQSVLPVFHYIRNSTLIGCYYRKLKLHSFKIYQPKGFIMIISRKDKYISIFKEVMLFISVFATMINCYSVYLTVLNLSFKPQGINLISLSTNKITNKTISLIFQYLTCIQQNKHTFTLQKV